MRRWPELVQRAHHFSVLLLENFVLLQQRLVVRVEKLHLFVLFFVDLIDMAVAVLGASPIDFAIGWVLNNRLVSAVLAGPRTEEQWEDYLAALKYRFTPEDEALVDRLVPAGHASTPGYNDPAYPIEGRKVRTGS